MPSFIYQLYQYPLMWRQSHDEIQSGVCTLLWNNAMWLKVTSHMTIFNQSACTISEWSYYSNQKLLYEIGTHVHRRRICDFYLQRESEIWSDFNWPILEGVDLFKKKIEQIVSTPILNLASNLCSKKAVAIRKINWARRGLRKQ